MSKKKKPQRAAQVLVYQEELTHSVWVDFFPSTPDGKRVSRKEAKRQLREEVRSGRCVGWRLIKISKEVMGNDKADQKAESEFISESDTEKLKEQFPHDVFEDMSSRVAPEHHCSPRVLVVKECVDGQLSWGELGSDGQVGDTTLTGEVFRPIEKLIRSGYWSGTEYIDTIPYSFVFSRQQERAEPKK